MAQSRCPVQNKLIYPNRTAAIRAALSYSKKRGTPLRTYWHKACGGWHLSSKRKEEVGVPRCEVA
jgi:hypothetical protein